MEDATVTRVVGENEKDYVNGDALSDTAEHR